MESRLTPKAEWAGWVEAKRDKREGQWLVYEYVELGVGVAQRGTLRRATLATIGLSRLSGFSRPCGLRSDLHAISPDT